MQHVDFAGGIEQMEVDHFDSTKKKDYLQQYENLFLAKGSCNRKTGGFCLTLIHLGALFLQF